MILTKGNKKEINLDLLVETKVKAGKLYELLIIVPTNRKIRSLKRELITTSPGKATSKIYLETIGTYSINLLLGENVRNSLVSEQASITLLSQCIQEKDLKYFSFPILSWWLFHLPISLFLFCRSRLKKRILP